MISNLVEVSESTYEDCRASEEKETYKIHTSREWQSELECWTKVTSKILPPKCTWLLGELL